LIPATTWVCTDKIWLICQFPASSNPFGAYICMAPAEMAALMASVLKSDWLFHPPDIYNLLPINKT